MKLEIKQSYTVNGIEYSSLQEAKKAIGIIDIPKEKNKPQTIRSSQLINVSNLKVSEYMGKMSLQDGHDLAALMSNQNIKFWIPSYHETVSLVQNEKTNDWNDCDSYWTSTQDSFSTYVFYNKRINQFEDIFPDLKLGIRFLFKEN
jgi:hypothetical protein